MVSRCTFNVVAVYSRSDVEVCNRRNMTKINQCVNCFLLTFILIFSAISLCSSAISNKRLCFDPNCSVPISLARTVSTYTASDPSVLSFRIDRNVTIYSKGAGNRSDLWGVEIDGRRGYAPQSLLREYKVLQTNLTFEVPTRAGVKKTNGKSDQHGKREKKLDIISTERPPLHGTIDVPKVVPTEEETQVPTISTQNLPPAFNVVEGTILPLDNVASHAPSSVRGENVEATIVSVPGSVDNVVVTSEDDLCGQSAKCEKSEDTEESLDIKREHSLPLPNVDENSVETVNINKLAEDSSTADYNKTAKGNITTEAQTENDRYLSTNDTDRDTYDASKAKAESVVGNAESVVSNAESVVGNAESVVSNAESVVGNAEPKEATVQLPLLNLVSGSTNAIQVPPVISNTENVEEKIIPVSQDQPPSIEMEVAEIEKLTEKSTHTCGQNDLFSMETTLSDSSVPKEIDPVTNNVLETKSPVEEATVVLRNEDTVDEVTEHEQQNNTSEDTGVDYKDNIPDSELLVETKEESVNGNVNSTNNLMNNTISPDLSININYKSHDDQEQQQEQEELATTPQPILHSSHENVISDDESKQTVHFPDFLKNRNLLNTVENVAENNDLLAQKQDKIDEHLPTESLPEYEDATYNSEVVTPSESDTDMDTTDSNETLVDTPHHEELQDTVLTDSVVNDEDSNIIISTMERGYWETMMYVIITACTTLIFSLGYYYIENGRRDSQLIAKVNKLEKELLVSSKECAMLDESLKSTKTKLARIEDELFGSNEMVLSLKADLDTSQCAKSQLEYQVDWLEQDLESATESGLELERMLREFLSKNNEVNPLAQCVEDLQARLNAQQTANEWLKNVLNLKTQENENLLADLDTAKRRCGEIEVELARVTEDLKLQMNRSNTLEENLKEKVRRLEMQMKEICTEKSTLSRELKTKEAEVKDIAEAMNQLNSNTLDLAKLYDVSRIKAEAAQLREERDELKVRLTEVEGAHNLLEEHVKLVKEEVSTLSEQCKTAEKDKRDAETRLEVLSNFFKEKETKRQREEAIWLQKQGEVTSTVERIQTMQNEMQNYKQQIEMLRREIVDQEREYKGQISALETKAHEQWVAARQNERRLEESKAEAGQLRNRLTLIEKNINADADPEAKLHRLEANGETTTSPPLFMGADSSSSPIMFTGSSGVPPPPPPSYMHCSLFPPYLPPPLPGSLPSGGPGAGGMPPPPVSSYDPVGQRPPPLGGRLSSPPPPPLHPPPLGGSYDNAGSPPPPMSPHMLPPYDRHRSPAMPPPPPLIPPHFVPKDHHLPPHHHAHPHSHPPPPPPAGSSMLPPTAATAATAAAVATTATGHHFVATHSWAKEATLPTPLRTFSFHPHQREQGVRNHKGSLHSSGDSLDKTHYTGKA